MIATRRLARARHEFRFGTREILIIGGVLCLMVGLVFAAGVYVGREMTGRKGPARAEGPRDSGKTDADGARAEAPIKTAATRAEEKVTFYRTLTAPTSDLPQVGKPTIEERLVPKEEPSPPSAPPAPPVDVAAPPEEPRPLAERRVPKAPEASPAPRQLRPTRPPGPPMIRPAPAQVAAVPTAAEPELWSVQVSAFRSRSLADELRVRLAARGFDAYILTSVTEDGRPRYRVRVGAYPTRNDAERVAAELRTERGLNPLVTPRTR
jgi:cell division septation protein DedD